MSTTAIRQAIAAAKAAATYPESPLAKVAAAAEAELAALEKELQETQEARDAGVKRVLELRREVKTPRPPRLCLESSCASNQGDYACDCVVSP